MKNELGDGPIQNDYRERMVAVMEAVDEVFNGQDREERSVGAVLLVFPYKEHNGRC